MRTLFHFALHLLVALPVFAQSLVLYPGGSDPTTGGGNAIPFSATFANDVRYQLSIPAMDLPSQPMLLTDVGFAPTASGSLVIPNLIMSVGHRTPGALSCNLLTNSNDLTQQFSGSHTYSYTSGTWSSFGIPLAFAYNGQDGLLIEVRLLGTSGGAAFNSRDNGTNVERTYNRLAGGFNATTCSHGVSLGLKLELTFLPLILQPQANPIGLGCQGSGGTTALLASTLPAIGNSSFALDLTQAAASSPAWLFASPAQASPLIILGACTVYLDPAGVLALIPTGIGSIGPVTTGPTGAFSFSLPIPNDPALAGITLYFQGAVTDAGAAGGFTTSNAMELVVY